LLRVLNSTRELRRAVPRVFAGRVVDAFGAAVVRRRVVVGVGAAGREAPARELVRVDVPGEGVVPVRGDVGRRAFTRPLSVTGDAKAGSGRP